MARLAGLRLRYNACLARRRPSRYEERGDGGSHLLSWLRGPGRGRGWSWVLVLVASLWSAQGKADVRSPEPFVPHQGVQEILAAHAWLGPSAAASLEDARSGRIAFTPIGLRNAIPFRPGHVLWLRLRIQASADEAQTWRLELPAPVIDAVSLHQRDAAGRWTVQRAGDTVPMKAWGHPARHPSFGLALRAGAPSEVLLEIRHSTRLAVPLRLVSGTAHEQRAQLEYLGLGLAFGVLGLLVAIALVAATVLRDPAYACYAAFALLAMLALGAYTGVASHLVWGNLPAWSDAAPGVLTLLAGAAALQMGRYLSPGLARTPWLAAALDGGVGAGLILAGPYAFLARREGMILLGLHVLWVVALSLYVSVRTWQRGERAGLWMLIGAVPLVLAVPISVVRGFGWLQASWLADYALVCALSFELPMLLAALYSRSEERWGVELRRLAASHQDALTGALKREGFVAKLRHAVQRQRLRGEGAALVVVELANHASILAERGAEAAEDALLRTVVKLRRLVRDVDTTGRLGEHRFGLLLEGLSVRRPVGAIAARLIASGLMEEPSRPKEPLLQLHVVATLTSEHPGTADVLLQTLEAMLGEMAPRTRRAFRFYEVAAVAEVGEGAEVEGSTESVGGRPSAGLLPD